MLFYNEIIKQNDSYQFETTNTVPCVELKEAIKRLLTDFTAGIHAMVVCTDHVDKVLSAEEFKHQLSDEQRTVVILPQDSDIPAGTVGCARLEPYDYLGKAMQAMIELVERVVGSQYINQDAKKVISIYCSHEDMREKVPLHIKWSKELANRASQMLYKDKMQSDAKLIPHICILLILPESLFDNFLHGDCYFPPFIEYVVHAVDGEQALKALRTQMREKDEQLEEKDQIIWEQRQFINKVKNELAELQSMIDANNISQVPDTTRPVTEEFPKIKTLQQPETVQTEMYTYETRTR